MCYPPGIPIVSPGELITAEILEYIDNAIERGCSMQGPKSLDLSELEVLK
jgi:arginine/lysine/ornithine decarboxylase